MNFAVEVPGEASPLNIQELCKALEAATSMDNSQRVSAGKQLAAWDTQQNYFPLLQAIFLDKTVPREIRFLAILMLKNGTDKYWRVSAHNALGKDDKAAIKSRLFEGTIGEEDKAFALHNALTTARIIRIDYPTNWPEAIPSLIGLLRQYRNGDQSYLSGALLLLLRVVKELGTARMRKSQTALQAITPEMVFLLDEIYTERTTLWTNWLASGQGNAADAELAMQNSLAAAKILRRLLIFGFENPAKDSNVIQFWSTTQNHFGQFLNYVSHDSPIPATYQELVGKHLLQFTKLHLEMTESHPASFPLLPNSISLVLAYWELVAKFAEVFDKSNGLRQVTATDGDHSKSKVEGPLLERLALKGLLILKSCVAIVWRPVNTFRYLSKEFMAQKDEAVEIIRSQLLKDELVMQIVNVIITKLLIFREADLEAWESDPEEFEASERYDGDAWQYNVRPCAERVFLDLLVHYKTLLTPPLLSYFNQATTSSAEIITKEAIYTAMGASAPNLELVFDFDSFLATTLVQDAQVTGPLAKVLRRRIAILISIWVPIKIAPESRPLIFDIFRHLLNDQDVHNDEVVRLTAARQLKEIAEDFSFKGETFAPYAAGILPQIMNLLPDVAVEDTKQALFETLRLCIQRMEQHILPFAEPIIGALPALWEAAGEAYMIKAAIIGVLSALVYAIGAESRKYQDIMLPIIAQCMSGPSDSAYLEDILELWLSLLRESKAPLSAQMVSIAHLAFPVLVNEPHMAENAHEILKAYIVLAPEAVLSDDLRPGFVASLCGPLMTPSRSRGADALTGYSILEFMFYTALDLGGVDGAKIVVQDLLSLGLPQTILQRIHEDWEAQQLTGPLASKKESLEWTYKIAYFGILARITLAEPSLLETVITASGGDLAQVWPWLSTQWFDIVPNLSDPDRIKLGCLALTRLMTLPTQPMQDLVCSKLQDYFTIWQVTVHEAHDGEPLGPDGLVWPEVPTSEESTPYEVAWFTVAARDPVHTVHTYPYVKEVLQGLVERVGGEGPFRENWVVNVDKEKIQAFEDLSRGISKRS